MRSVRRQQVPGLAPGDASDCEANWSGVLWILAMYQLEWWGDAFGIKSACFRIASAGQGRYQALEANGLVLFDFTVSK